jgi:hypothetical protein
MLAVSIVLTRSMDGETARQSREAVVVQPFPDKTNMERSPAMAIVLAAVAAMAVTFL